MKIAIITGALPPAKCGVGDYTDILASFLAKKGIEISVITDKKYRLNDASYNVYSCIEKWHGLLFFKRILHILREICPDIVHIQYPTISYKWHPEINILPMLLRLYGYKVVYTLHEYSQRPMLSKIRRWPSILYSNVVICVENDFVSDIKRLPLLFSREKIYEVRIGSNIPHSTNSSLQNVELRGKIWNNYNGKICSYFGFINPNKCFDLVIKTMGKLKENDELHFRLLIISQLSEKDNYQNQIIELIKQYNLKDEVKILGYVSKDKVGNYIACSDFGICLFKNGVSPRNGSFLAMYQEHKTIVTTRSVLINPVEWNDLIFVENTESDLYEVLSSLQIDKTSHKDNQNIDWNIIAQKHVEIYKKLLA